MDNAFFLVYLLGTKERNQLQERYFGLVEIPLMSHQWTTDKGLWVNWLDHSREILKTFNWDKIPFFFWWGFMKKRLRKGVIIKRTEAYYKGEGVQKLAIYISSIHHHVNSQRYHQSTWNSLKKVLQSCLDSPTFWVIQINMGCLYL